LPFPSVLVYSSDDPYARAERSQQLATDWAARPQRAGPRGHLNGDSGLGDWPEGLALLGLLGA
jgi:predicted alpha/beta hydrolase family esterase